MVGPCLRLEKKTRDKIALKLIPKEARLVHGVYSQWRKRRILLNNSIDFVLFNIYKIFSTL
jgi:hypothetical protein